MANVTKKTDQNGYDAFEYKEHLIVCNGCNGFFCRQDIECLDDYNVCKDCRKKFNWREVTIMADVTKKTNMAVLFDKLNIPSFVDMTADEAWKACEDWEDWMYISAQYFSDEGWDNAVRIARENYDRYYQKYER